MVRATHRYKDITQRELTLKAITQMSAQIDEMEEKLVGQGHGDNIAYLIIHCLPFCLCASME